MQIGPILSKLQAQQWSDFPGSELVAVGPWGMFREVLFQAFGFVIKKIAPGSSTIMGGLLNSPGT